MLLNPFVLLIGLFLGFYFSFLTGSYYVALAGLGFMMQTRLVLNSRFSHLSLSVLKL